MKDKFYNFVIFLSKEIHFFEYLMYMILLAVMFTFYECYNYNLRFLEMFVYMIVGMAFMNTWTIQAKKHVDNKNIKNNKNSIDK